MHLIIFIAGGTGSSSQCFEANVAYSGPYINGKIANKDYYNGNGKRESALQCQQLCKQTKECKFFYWHTKIFYCLMLKSKWGQTLLADHTAGPVSCGKSILSIVVRMSIG